MLTMNEAKHAILKEFDDMKIKSSFDYKDRYIFVLVPKNYDEKKDLGFVDNYHAVYKDTGEVSGFAPWNETGFFDMLLEQGGD